MAHYPTATSIVNGLIKMSQHHIKINFHESISPDQGLVLTPFQRKLLTTSLQMNLRLEYRHRIEIMLLADQGYSQTQICEALGCCHETARYWIAIARAGKAHEWNDNQMGRPRKVSEQYLNRLKELTNRRPRDCGYPFQRWTAHYLGKHLAKETGIQVSSRHINRLLKEMGLSTRCHDPSVTTQNQPDSTDTQRCAQSDIVIQELQETALPEHLWLFNMIQTAR